ncbi:protein PBDC1 isoform X1 [Fundulus heteroclitus]|uniref:protein PBDC1 isoform X1 n=1 Tax=Fundulus heteroclitus TaxID=8078 RepID=UPI00165CCD8A|nr:protein PBDC1 isoform X1 [Fundulus heteroclitus]
MASHEALAALGVEGASAAAHALSLPAEAYGNDPRLEVMWAMKAYNHAEVYFNVTFPFFSSSWPPLVETPFRGLTFRRLLALFQLISSVEPKFLKLTKVDDQLYSSFRETFKELDVKQLKEGDLKSDEAKERWRPFCNQFEGIVEDFNYGTLLRLDCEKDYSEENTIFATRVQFFAVEIARNREGYNDAVFRSKRSKS